MMVSTRPTSLGRPSVTDGGSWGEGNDGSGNGQTGDGIRVGIVPLTDEKDPDPYGLDGDFVRIYPVENGLKAFAKIVLAVPNGSGDLPLHFEPNGPLYPGCRGTKHSSFDPDMRILNIRAEGDDSLSDEGLLTVSAETTHLRQDQYTLTITDDSTCTVLKEVELVQNAAVE